MAHLARVFAVPAYRNASRFLNGPSKNNHTFVAPKQKIGLASAIALTTVVRSCPLAFCDNDDEDDEEESSKSRNSQKCRKPKRELPECPRYREPCRDDEQNPKLRELCTGCHEGLWSQHIWPFLKSDIFLVILVIVATSQFNSLFCKNPSNGNGGSPPASGQSSGRASDATSGTADPFAPPSQ